MKREKNLTQILNSFKMLVIVCLSTFMAFSFTACDQESEEPLAYHARADSLQLSEVSTRSLRAMETTSPDWKEGSYDRVMANQYQISTPEKLSGNRYRFKVRSNHLSRFEVWIKYYSPKGDVVYQKLDPDRQYINFTLDRTFQQEGVYYCRFFISKQDKNGAYPSIHQSSIAINVVLPLYIPPVTDDYEQYKQHKGYDKENGLYYDQWYFGLYQCTSWVALKVNQMWGTKTAFGNKMFGQVDKLGDAQNWMRILTKYGYSADQTPKPGDIIWFPPNVKQWNSLQDKTVTYATGLGHVGFVHEVNNEFIVWTAYHGGKKGSHTRDICLITEIPSVVKFIHVQKKR